VGNAVGYFEINAPDAPTLWRFYEQVFGWTVTPDPDDGYGDVRTNGVCLGTGEPGIDGGIGPARDSFVTVYVQVPDLDEALARVEALGGETVQPPTRAGQVEIALFRDPAGNRIGLVRG